MSEFLFDLERQRAALLAQFPRLTHLRPGCVTGIVRRCGKPTCHCAQPGDRGHGLPCGLLFNTQGQTIREWLSNPAAVRKAEQEIVEFRKYQELSRSLLEVNEEICRLRPIEEGDHPSAQARKRRKRSSGKSRGN